MLSFEIAFAFVTPNSNNNKMSTSIQCWKLFKFAFNKRISIFRDVCCCCCCYYSLVAGCWNCRCLCICVCVCVCAIPSSTHLVNIAINTIPECTWAKIIAFFDEPNVQPKRRIEWCTIRMARCATLYKRSQIRWIVLAIASQDTWSNKLNFSDTIFFLYCATSFRARDLCEVKKITKLQQIRQTRDDFHTYTHKNANRQIVACPCTTGALCHVKHAINIFNVRAFLPTRI